MPKFQVEMLRTMTQTVVVEIEATDKHEAAKKAYDIKEDLEWSTTDTNYDFPDVEVA